MPLLADARFADVTLALCVPLCAALAHTEHRQRQQLGASRAALQPPKEVVPNTLLRHCTALLLSAACADAPRGGAAAVRTARVLRVLTDCMLLQRCSAVSEKVAHTSQTLT